MSAIGKKSGSDSSGFTLVELVIAITVLGILTGIAVPAIDGIQKERLAREPVRALLQTAREVRLRAMKERRPYQIVFDSSGFKAARFFQPYGGLEEFEQLRVELEQVAQRDEILEASRARGIQMQEEEIDPRVDAVQEGLQYFQEYTFPDSLRVSLRFWDETQWVQLSGGEFRRWIFQPSGMCEPMKIRAEADSSFFEVDFHPLTADVKSERSWVE